MLQCVKHLPSRNKPPVMEIITLQSISLSSLTSAFNRGFSDYAIKFQFTDEDFQKKIISENIIQEYSVGAFEHGELIAFILHGLEDIDGQKRVFNAGTGVAPKYRGQRIVEKLYNYILPVLKNKGYRHHQLEVLDGNDKAEKIYAKVGFLRSRHVISFSGTVAQYSDTNIEIKEVRSLDWTVVKTFCNVEPTWQNSFSAIQRTIDHYTIVEAYYKNEFAGFAIYDPKTGRLRQFGVKKECRSKGIGKSLFAYAGGKIGQVSFTNYDMSDYNSIAFFTSLGLKSGNELIEMRLHY